MPNWNHQRHNLGTPGSLTILHLAALLPKIVIPTEAQRCGEIRFSTNTAIPIKNRVPHLREAKVGFCGDKEEGELLQEARRPTLALWREDGAPVPLCS